MKPGLRNGCFQERRGARGIILLQVSFLILVLMGILALVVDLGIARATQSMMQTSADIAAMEALRFRDADPDPVQAELDRRATASRVAAYVFDEDLDLSTGAVDYRLGAGPQITTGVAGVDDPEGGLLESQGPYLPVLELNVDNNEVFGDLVAGSFTATDPAQPGNPHWHGEDGGYQRFDFEPSPAADAVTANAFLARVRRTNDLLGLDRQAGVSSAGPTLPYLFGLGSGVLTTDDPGVYDPRRDGITVRATSIADAKPVVAAGVMSDVVNGLLRVGSEFGDPTVARVLAFRDDIWRTNPALAVSFEITVPTAGVVSGQSNSEVPVPIDGNGMPGPPLFASPAAGWLRVGERFNSIPSALELPPTTLGLSGRHYVALYTFAGGQITITGFAAVFISGASVTPGGSELTLEGRKLASFIAPENASAVPALAQDLAALLPTDPLRQPLLAPVLAR